MVQNDPPGHTDLPFRARGRQDTGRGTRDKTAQYLLTIW